MKEVLPGQELDIPDNVIDRAHRIGAGKDGGPAAIIVKFTTWRHRTLLYRERAKITKNIGITLSLDITRDNIIMMDKVKDIAKELNAPIAYVFCDINCQPTIKISDSQFMRFDTVEEATKILEKLVEK